MTVIVSPRPFLAPFRWATFRAIWIASVSSHFGGLIQTVGAAWAMTSIGSPRMVAAVQVSTALPVVLLSLVAGVFADNFDRRRVMISAQVFMLAASIALATITAAGLLTPWLLLACTFAIGCGAAFHRPSWQASVVDMVGKEDLAGAITLNGAGFNIARSAGPALGGVIVAAAGVGAAFLANAFSYLGLIFVLLRWRAPRSAPTLPRERFARAAAVGLGFVRMSPGLRLVIGRSLVYGAGAGAIPALMPLMRAN